MIGAPGSVALLPIPKRSVPIAGLTALLLWVAWSLSWRLVPGWSADDGVHLRFSAIYDVQAYLFNPELLQIASYANLTPLLNLFYSFSLHQFGLDVTAWRILLTGISVFAVAAFYGATSQYMRPMLALFVSGAWALGLPFFFTAATFMTSHYLLGMLFSSVCVFLFARWMLEGHVAFVIGALLFYALAIFSKEVFVPLPALLLLHRPWRKAILGVIPMAMLLILYLAARSAVLGGVVGGYQGGQYINTLDVTGLMSRLAQLPATLWGGTWQAAIVGMVMLVLLLRTFKILWLLVVATGIVVLVPLLPLIAASGLTEPDRYFLVASALTLFLTGAMIETSLRQRLCTPWVAMVACGLVLLVHLQQHMTRVPPFVRALGTQAAIYNHVLVTKGPLVIVNPELPADSAYWSAVLNGARETQARLQNHQNYDKALMVGDVQSPVIFGLQAQGITTYRYDSQGCRCLTPYTPVGEPNLAPVTMVPQRTMVLHLLDPLRHPENNQSGWGNSQQTARRIASDDPATLEITGHIHLSTELDWLYLVLPFVGQPVIEPSAPSLVIRSERGDPLRPFHLRLRFATPQLAAQALAKLCLAVPAVVPSPYALLQGQPAYCNVFVNPTLRFPS